MSGYSNLAEPGKGAVAVTFSDTVDSKPSRALRFDAGGTARIRWVDGSETTRTYAQGEFVPMRAVRVYATGTDAGLVGNIDFVY